jgi:hypothetical protein
MKFEVIFLFDLFPDESGADEGGGENVAKLNQIPASSQLSTEIGHDTALSEIILLSVRPVQMLNRARCNLSAARRSLFLNKEAAFSELDLIVGLISSL